LFNHFSIPSINCASGAAAKAPHGALTFSGGIKTIPANQQKQFSVDPANYCGTVLHQYFNRIIFLARPAFCHISEQDAEHSSVVLLTAYLYGYCNHGFL
jgi:hypothetical protein